MRAGLTLVEVMVALAIVAIAVGAGVGALPALQVTPSQRNARRDAIRAEAIRSGASLMLQASSGGPARFLPDGRVVELGP